MLHTRPVFLFSDFGWQGPYVGQMLAAILDVDAGLRVTSLMHDAPPMRPDLAAYLLPGVCAHLPKDAIVVAVVDPGVGSDRDALIVETEQYIAVGPNNGLLTRLPAIEQVRRIDWRPEALSASFHGRDLFAPVGARLAVGGSVQCTEVAPGSLVGADWPPDRCQITYIDGFGNAMTGLRSKNTHKNKMLHVSGRILDFARTFSEAPLGGLFWTANSQGMVEIAGNGASAASILRLALGDEFLIN